MHRTYPFWLILELACELVLKCVFSEQLNTNRRLLYWTASLIAFIGKGANSKQSFSLIYIMIFLKMFLWNLRDYQ